MKCVFCDNPATVHLTDVSSLPPRQVHLCEACARAKKVFSDPPGPGINPKALAQLLVGPLLAARAAAPADPVCPACGLTYAGFKAEGRFGCRHDYDAFAAALTPLLERVHRATAHTGKLPAALRRAAELTDLRGRLKAAVAAEDYEAAAGLRDRIRQKEAEGTPG
jgi:protein arginine kinase activator